LGRLHYIIATISVFALDHGLSLDLFGFESRIIGIEEAGRRVQP
jgi:hypothetical protein